MAPLPLAIFNTGSSQDLWTRIPSAVNVGTSIKWHYGDPNQLGYSGIFDWSTVKSKRADATRIQKRDDEIIPLGGTEPVDDVGIGEDFGHELDTHGLKYVDGVLESWQIADENPEGLGWDLIAPLSPIAEEGRPLSPIAEEDKPLSPIAEEGRPLSPIAEED